MIVIEAISGGRRLLLSALDPLRSYCCGAGDGTVIERLRALNGGNLPGMITFSREAFLQFLPVLSGHERITFGKSRAAAVTTDAIRPRLDVIPQEDGSLRLRVSLQENGSALLAGDQSWLLQGSTFSPLAPGLPSTYQ